MSSYSSKISDVIEILSVETVADDHQWNLPVPVDHEREKQIFTDAINYCVVLLRQSNRLSRNPSNLLSLEATLLGHEIFERIVSINVRKRVETIDKTIDESTKIQEPQQINESVPRVSTFEDHQIDIKEESIADNDPEEIVVLSPPRQAENHDNTEVIDNAEKSNVERVNDEMDVEREISASASFNITESSETNSKNLPPSPLSLSSSIDSVDKTRNKKKAGSKKGIPKSKIPLDLKKKAIELAVLHPEWRLKDLRENGVSQLSSLRQLWQWEEQVASGGVLEDKYREISKQTYERFLAARKKSVTVTKEILRDWALDVARNLYGSRLKFDASPHWLKSFRKSYGLNGNPITGYYKENDRKSTRTTKPTQKKRKK